MPATLEPPPSVPAQDEADALFEEARRRQRRRRRGIAVVLLAAGLATVLLLRTGGSAPTPPRSGAGRAPAHSHAAVRAPRARPVIPSLAGSSVVDLTWVSPKDGWALLRGSCVTEFSCSARLAHTQNGGRSWTALPNPPAQLAPGAGCSIRVCVKELRFATPSIGYLFGPSLLMTRNGGRSWTPVASPPVESLEPGADAVVRVTSGTSACPGPCRPAIEAASPGSEHWQLLPAQLAWTVSTSPKVIRAGEAIYLVVYRGGPAMGWQTPDVYRSLDDGRSWAERPEPCGGSHWSVRSSAHESLQHRNETVDLAAAPGGFLVVLCQSFNGESASVMTSEDYGDTWGPRHPLPELVTDAQFHPQQIAAASPTGLLISDGGVSGGGTNTHTLLFSSDGGEHWAKVASERSQLQLNIPTPTYLGFENSHVGRWISSRHVIWTTTDGGSHWTRRPFP